jgi:L-alanine-DL-glutamate epimerase-like enolase superfamily enzyme
MTNATWPVNKPIPTFQTAREEAEFWSKYGPSIAARSNLTKAETVLLQARCRLPLLVDGPCASRRDARLFLDRGARALSAKPSRVGLTECRGIVASAAERGAATVAGLFGESALGSIAGLALASCLPRHELDLPAELSFHLMFSEQILRFPVAVEGGAIKLRSEAGLAPLIDWELVARRRPG